MSFADRQLTDKLGAPTVHRPADWPDGWQLIACDRVDSTSRLARDLAVQGAPHGTVVTARRQDQGRGRHGRLWAPVDGNLYVSAVLRPPGPPETAGQLTFVVALTVADTLRALAPGIAPSLKWPNDVLVDGGKISGILLEAEVLADRSAVWVVAGVGINLVGHPADTPYPATDLKAAGAGDVSPDRALSAFISALDLWYGSWCSKGFVPVRDAWLADAAGLGQMIEVRLPDQTLSGVFAGLDEDGGLLLDLPEGGRRRIAAGDVFFTGRSEGGHATGD